MRPPSTGVDVLLVGLPCGGRLLVQKNWVFATCVFKTYCEVNACQGKPLKRFINMIHCFEIWSDGCHIVFQAA